MAERVGRLPNDGVFKVPEAGWYYINGREVLKLTDEEAAAWCAPANAIPVTLAGAAAIPLAAVPLGDEERRRLLALREGEWDGFAGVDGTHWYADEADHG